MRLFQIIFVLVSCFVFSNCSSLHLVDLDAARDNAEIARGEKPQNGHYYGREQDIAKKVIRERTPDVDEQGRYEVILRNNSYRDVKMKVYKTSFWRNVEWFGARLGREQEVRKRLPVGKYLVVVYYHGLADARQTYTISTAEEYDSKTGEYVAKVIEYDF